MIGKLPVALPCAPVKGAADYELRIVIRSVKNTTAAPLGLVSPYVSAQG